MSFFDGVKNVRINTDVLTSSSSSAPRQYSSELDNALGLSSGLAKPK